MYNSYRYTFDRVYDPHSQQAEVYEHSARDAVHQALEVRPTPATPAAFCACRRVAEDIATGAGSAVGGLLLNLVALNA